MSNFVLKKKSHGFAGVIIEAIRSLENGILDRLLAFHFTNPNVLNAQRADSSGEV